MNNKKLLITSIVLILIGMAFFLLSQSDLVNISTFVPASTKDTEKVEEVIDGVPKLVSSTPAEGAVVRESSIEVSLAFDEPIQDFSYLDVMYLDDPLTTKSATLSSDRKTLSLPVNLTNEGAHQVNYTACTSETACYTSIFYFNYSK